MPTISQLVERQSLPLFSFLALHPASQTYQKKCLFKQRSEFFYTSALTI